MTTKEAIARLGVEDEMELLEAAHDNQVPIPGTPSDEDISNADAFVKAILKVA